MATKGTSISAEPTFGEEGFSSQTRKRAPDSRLRESGYVSSAVGGDPADARDTIDAAEDFTLVPLVDKIAFGFASGLAPAVKELEQYIGSETRKVADTVERQLDGLQIHLQELFRFVAEQRSVNVTMQDHMLQLAAAGSSLQENDARQAVELAAIRSDARELSASVSQRIESSAVSLRELDSRHSSELSGLHTEYREFSNTVSGRIDVAVVALQESDAKQAADLGAFRSESKSFRESISERVDNLCGDACVQQEDIVAVKATLGSVCARIDALLERLDRQAESVRQMHTNYSQREAELEQVVNGLARLRAFPTPLPANGL